MHVSTDLSRRFSGLGGVAGRWSFGRVLVLVVLANLLIGAALFALRPPRGAPPEPLIPPPPLPAPVAELRSRLAAGQHGEPYTLAMTDDELTALAAWSLANAPDVPFTRVKVAVTGDRVIAEGVTRGLAVTVPVRIVGTVAAADGLPRVTIQDVSLGDTPLPPFVRDQILREANASLDFSRRPMPVTVDAVELRPGGLTVRGVLK
jgi:hypothetical protein